MSGQKEITNLFIWYLNERLQLVRSEKKKSIFVLQFCLIMQYFKKQATKQINKKPKLKYLWVFS